MEIYEPTNHRVASPYGSQQEPRTSETDPVPGLPTAIQGLTADENLWQVITTTIRSRSPYVLFTTGEKTKKNGNHLVVTCLAACCRSYFTPLIDSSGPWQRYNWCLCLVSLNWWRFSKSQAGWRMIQLKLVGGLNPSEKYYSIGMIIPNIWENKKCSKPPTSKWVSHD